MIKLINSWAGQIIVSVIIGVILELILPECKNKKYIKIVIGMFIVFSIISPIIEKVFGKDLIKDIFSEYSNYLDNNYQISTNIDSKKNIEEVYKSNLNADIKAKLLEKGYSINYANIEIETNDTNYGKINKIDLQISKTITKEEVSVVNKVEINISNTVKNKESSISAEEKEDLISYICETYDIEKENITIN